MATKKFSQFTDGGSLLSTDTVVGLRSGVNYKFSPQTGQLLSSNNLSDVANTQTSRNNLSVAKRSSGSGSPQGLVAGELSDTYIDTTAPTNKFYICIVAGNSVSTVWQLQSDVNNALLIPNNLSDVANPVTSLSNIGGQPINILGTGNPNGAQAGTAGINIYYDSASQQYWNCTTTGTSSTAVWTSSRDIFPVNYIDFIAPPVQLEVNNIYLARVTSPSPANAIMPVAPSLGDLLIIYATGAAGVNITIGTANAIRISNTSVSSTFFMPANSSIVLRCVVDVGGGQWRAESIVGNLTIDGSIQQNAIDNVQQPLNLTGAVDPNGNVAGTAGINFYFNTVTLQMWRCISTGNSATAVWTPITQESNILPANTVYFSALIGSDTLGNGSESFPFATYNFAATYAAGLATSTNQYAVFPMGQEIVSGDIVIYPFVNFSGLNSDTNSLSTTGNLVVDASWGTTPNSSFSCVNVGLDIQAGVNIILPAPQGAQFLFINSPFSNSTPSITSVGTDSTSFELMVFINEVSIQTRPDITATNFITAVDNSGGGNITSINNSSNKPSILVFLGNSLLTNSGTTTIQTVVPGQASLFLATATLVSNLVLDGTNSIAEVDSVSYPSSVSFLNGATFTNVNLVTLSDGVSANDNFTPANYTLPVATLYPSSSVTNNLVGIDNELGIIKTPSVVQADRHGAATPILVTGFLICTDVREDTNSLYNNSTGTFTADKDGLYEFNYEVHTSGTGTSVPLNTVYYIDAAFYKNGAFLDVQYSSNRNTGILNGVIVSTNNHGHAIIRLVAGDTINVNVVQNGNIPLTLLSANFSAKYIRN
jgi:hypothetical protein